MQLCQEEDVSLLCWLLPAVYTQFSQVAVGNTALLHLVVQTVDARQLQELVCRVVQGEHHSSLFNTPIGVLLR